MEEAEKGKTAKYLRDKQGVPQHVKDNLKEFIRMKKLIIETIGEEELTIVQVSEKSGIPLPDTLYYMMSLIKYGVLKEAQLDDMDEYFTYKLLQNR